MFFKSCWVFNNICYMFNKFSTFLSSTHHFFCIYLFTKANTTHQTTFYYESNRTVWKYKTNWARDEKKAIEVPGIARWNKYKNGTFIIDSVTGLVIFNQNWIFIEKKLILIWTCFFRVRFVQIIIKSLIP